MYFINKIHRMFALLFIITIGYPILLPAADKKITIGGLPFPPYIITDEHSVPRGIIIETISEAFKRSGLKVTFNITNWPRAFQQAKFGRVDAIIPIMKSTDREKIFHFPDTPLIYFDQYLIASSDSSINYNGSMQSLKPYSIGRLRNARVSPLFDAAMENGIIYVEERSTVELLIKAVALKRLDMIAINNVVAMTEANRQGFRNRLKLIQPKLASVPIYLAFSKKQVDRKTASLVSNVLLEMKKDGTIKQITSQYTGDP